MVYIVLSVLWVIGRVAVSSVLLFYVLYMCSVVSWVFWWLYVVVARCAVSCVCYVLWVVVYFFVICVCCGGLVVSGA